MKKATKKVPLPTKQQILEFIRESPTPVGKREIARAFHIRGDDRVALKALLKDLSNDGELDRGRGRKPLLVNSFDQYRRSVERARRLVRDI